MGNIESLERTLSDEESAKGIGPGDQLGQQRPAGQGAAGEGPQRNLRGAALMAVDVPEPSGVAAPCLGDVTAPTVLRRFRQKR